jgi:crotonobetainyl-CoA:carnitine CoA-transferase CaiB-like acyl-CoA transferase
MIFKILEDLRVLDLTQFWFSPFCSMMLADLRADVPVLSLRRGVSTGLQTQPSSER